jgi:hypothetical protein
MGNCYITPSVWESWVYHIIVDTVSGIMPMMLATSHSLPVISRLKYVYILDAVIHHLHVIPVVTTRYYSVMNP